jgi:hypothetical protein
VSAEVPTLSAASERVLEARHALSVAIAKIDDVVLRHEIWKAFHTLEDAITKIDDVVLRHEIWKAFHTLEDAISDRNWDILCKRALHCHSGVK